MQNHNNQRITNLNIGQHQTGVTRQQQSLSIKGGSIHRPSSATLKRKEGHSQERQVDYTQQEIQTNKSSNKPVQQVYANQSSMGKTPVTKKANPLSKEEIL